MDQPAAHVSDDLNDAMPVYRYRYRAGGQEFESGGMAELTTFYCEEAIAFLTSCGMEDEGYYAALIRMFEQSLKWAMHLPANSRAPFLDRQRHVREAGRRIGLGVGDELGDLWDAVADDDESDG